MQQVLPSIEESIKDEMKEFQKYFKLAMKTEISLLNIVLKYLLKRRGKLMRPMFVLLTAKLLGEVNKSTYTAATLIELLHTATLVHDDVVDESFERRGAFSINALWKSKIAVLLGDFLLAKGLIFAMKNKEYELLEIVTNAVKEISEGELLQIQKTRKLNITESEYFEIIRKKTATLIAACTACGAKSINNGIYEEEYWNFGEKIGIAFQIKDDLLDYQINSKSGKPKGNDISEKKITLPLIFALEQAELFEKRRILSLLNSKNDDSGKLMRIIEFINKHKGIEYASEIMYSYREKALDFIKTRHTENQIRESIEKLIIYVTERNK
ncbi:polyprenyl synthetase family protein [Bacteroidota bacterium]